MPNAPSQDIKDLLVAAAIGVFAAQSGWSIAIGREPSQSDKAPHTTITIYDTGGDDANPALLLDHPTVQIRVRGDPNGYPAAYIKAQQIKDFLLGMPRQVVNTTDYIGVWITGDIFHLGHDENNRPLLTTNWHMAREPAAGTNRVSA